MNKAIYQLPNIFVTYKTASSPNPTFTVPELLSEFLLSVAKKRPSWEFKADASNLYSGAKFTSFGIWAHGRRIGGVSYRPRGSVNGIALECDAIGKAINRGNSKWTSKSKVAVDTFKKYFKEYTPDENLSRIGSTGNQKFSNLAFNASYMLQREADAMAGKLATLSAPLTEAHKQALLLFGFSKEVVEDFQTALVDKLFNAEQRVLADRGVAIYEYAGVYYAGRGEGYISYRNDSLPAAYKEKLGLLKLVEKDIVVPNVGYRISDNEFYLLGDEENVREEAA